MNDHEQLHCIECGEECDGSYRDAFDEPLCEDCGEELGYDGQEVEPDA